jgi:hypothetical protein
MARRFGRLYIGEDTQNQADQKGPLLLIPRRWSCPKLLTHAQGVRACLGKGGGACALARPRVGCSSGLYDVRSLAGRCASVWTSIRHAALQVDQLIALRVLYRFPGVFCHLHLAHQIATSTKSPRSAAQDPPLHRSNALWTGTLSFSICDDISNFATARTLQLAACMEGCLPDHLDQLHGELQLSALFRQMMAAQQEAVPPVHVDAGV